MFIQLMVLLILLINIFIIIKSKEVVSLSNPHFFTILYFSLFCIFQAFFINYSDTDNGIENLGLAEAAYQIDRGWSFYALCMVAYLIYCAFFSFKLDFSNIDIKPSKAVDISLVIRYGWISFFVSGVSTLIYLSLSNTSILEALFNPQKIYFVTDGANTDYTSYGYLSLLATISSIYAYFLYGCKCFYKLKFRVRDNFLLIILMALYMLYCIVTSSRGMIIGFLMTFFIIKSVSGGKVPVLGLVVTIVAFFGLFIVISASRYEIDLVDALTSLLSTIVLYSGGATIFNTSMIVENYPKESFMYGVSLLWIFTAPIPRFLWVDKPLVALDEVVAKVVYGYSDSALHTTPPGIFGELYINFGYFFALSILLLILYLYGSLVNEVLSKIRQGSFFHFLIYGALVSRLFYFFLSSSISAAIMNSLIVFSQLLIFTYFTHTSIIKKI